MAIRSNHYDAAFEAFLRTERRPYVAVDEARRALAPVAGVRGDVSLDLRASRYARARMRSSIRGRISPAGPRSAWRQSVVISDS